MQYLTPSDLCARWCNRVTEKTLANWRSRGEGPDYIKAGGAPLYPLDAVTAYENSRRSNLMGSSGQSNDGQRSAQPQPAI